MIRPIEVRDLEAVVPLFHLNWGEKWSMELMEERRLRWAHRVRSEFVFELDGRVIGWSEATQMKPGRAIVRLGVSPEFGRRGVGTALWQAVEQSFVDDAAWKAEVRDDDEGALAFASGHGFVRRSHDFESTIDLTMFDLSPFQGYVDQLQSSGLTVTTVAELGDDEATRFKLWEIEHITDHDIPNVNVADLPTWEDAQKVMFTASYYDPAGEFVALDGDRFVGLSGIAELTPGSYYNQHTCVLSEYRGRGIAVGLKALALDYARRRGGKTCRTNNNEDNQPMLAINQKFGFVSQPGWLELQRITK